MNRAGFNPPATFYVNRRYEIHPAAAKACEVVGVHFKDTEKYQFTVSLIRSNFRGDRIEVWTRGIQYSSECMPAMKSDDYRWGFPLPKECLPYIKEAACKMLSS